MEIDLPDIDTSGTLDIEIQYSVNSSRIGTIAFTLFRRRTAHRHRDHTSGSGDHTA